MSEKSIAISCIYVLVLMFIAVLAYDRGVQDTSSVDGDFKIRDLSLNMAILSGATLIAFAASKMLFGNSKYYTLGVVIGTAIYPVVLATLYVYFHLLEKRKILKKISTSL